MDTTKKYIAMCEKAKEMQIELHKWSLDTHLYKYGIDWRSQGYCAKHKHLLTEGYDGDTECSGFQKIRKAPHKGGWNAAEEERRYREDDCRGNSDKFWIVLPRQDQLQEMVIPNKKDLEILYYSSYPKKPYRFTIWYSFNKSYESDFFASLEQLWLAFVMREKYSKIWIKGEWRKKND